MPRADDHIPPLRFHFLTPAYDAALKAVGLGSAFRDKTLRWLALQPGETVLEVGCGTGTLTVAMARTQPAAVISALEIDDEALRRAKAAAAKAGATVQWAQGQAQEMPFADGSFDIVVSSLVLHHLDWPGKQAAGREIARVLRPGGRVLIVDFGPVGGSVGRIVDPVLAALRFEKSRDNFLGRIPEALERAGLVDVGVRGRHGGIVVAVGARKALAALD